MAVKSEYLLADINTKDILVNPKGQRDVERRKAQYNKIMREFDPNLVQPVSVARINGKYYCFDGQMTMKVLKARNRGRDLPVKCRVYNGMTEYEAAMMFVKQRGFSSNLAPADKLRVKANYGDEKATDFVRLTERNGLNISWCGSRARNTVVAVNRLWEEYLAFKGGEEYESFCRVIRMAWNGDPSSAHTKILSGVGLFMRTYNGQYKEDLLIKRLSKFSPAEIIRNADVDRSSGARKYAAQILYAYNYGVREENKLRNQL